MSSTLAAAPAGRSALRDPILALPVVVAVGLGVGWLGVDARAPGSRIAVDLALAWSFVSVALAALGQARYVRSRTLLCGSAFALLAADLAWARSDALWTLGFLLESLWVALLVHFVLTFPTGRAWSHSARLAIASAYALALGGQLARAVVERDGRGVTGFGTSERLADDVERALGSAASAIGLAVLALVVRRPSVLPPSKRRSHGPLLAGAALALGATLVWVVWTTLSDDSPTEAETAVRAVAVLVPLGLTAGVAAARLRRTDASDLVVELRTAGVASLRDRLAKALGDPTLDLAYRLDDGRYVDPSGAQIELPTTPDRAVTPVIAGGDEIAALVHDPALLDEPALVESVRATAGLVLENERLAAEVRSQLARVRASRSRIVAAADAERRRIERDLHDGAQQRLVALSVALGLAASRAETGDAALLSRAQDEIEEAIAELRELARGIHPTLLRDEGLEEAVKTLARRTPLPVTVEARAGGRLPDPVELAAYFAVSEALTNIVKHASASGATVRLERAGKILIVVVSDDGVGGADVGADSGLAGLRDRLEALDGHLTIDSPPGGGTTVRAELPCGS